jgi:Uma2 family endonuclease
VVCGEPKFADTKQDTLLNPTVVIEVLSPTTERFDRGSKMRRYQQIESLKEYVLVSQDQAVIEQLVRGSKGKWEQTVMEGLDAVLTFEAIAAKIPVAAIYAGVTFPEQPDI